LHLSSLKGKKVLLSFHPLAWTGVCAKQMKSLEANREALERYNTVALGLSVDAVPCKAAWAKELGIEHTQLLADFWPHGGVAAAYGVFRDKNGFSERANIIIDEKGTVIFAKVYPISELPDIEEILSVLR
jgi:peroxiredoxin